MPFGFAGVATGAATVFFAFIGFDAVSSAAEEVRNPQRDMPIGIISSLLVCTILYIAVSLTLTGIVPYLNQDWVAGFISLGAIVGITTVLLVMMYGQARMFFAMSRDSLLPELFSHVHPRTQVPQKSTLVVAALVATFGGLLPLSSLAQLTNIGTLFAFILVSIGLVVLRRTHRNYRVFFASHLFPCSQFSFADISFSTCLRSPRLVFSVGFRSERSSIFFMGGNTVDWQQKTIPPKHKWQVNL